MCLFSTVQYDILLQSKKCRKMSCVGMRFHCTEMHLPHCVQIKTETSWQSRRPQQTIYTLLSFFVFYHRRVTVYNLQNIPLSTHKTLVMFTFFIQWPVSKMTVKYWSELPRYACTKCTFPTLFIILLIIYYMQSYSTHLQWFFINTFLHLVFSFTTFAPLFFMFLHHFLFHVFIVSARRIELQLSH